ncbi:MAG: beta-galactosidase [Clostridium sp.]|nr:beta-galactosidase [Prevotella sp.]MCM1378110.1 beta-galactosidase [Prevotella sp.]MCM1428956.1 beta-galactosidase [Clostridium sp.]
MRRYLALSIALLCIGIIGASTMLCGYDRPRPDDNKNIPRYINPTPGELPIIAGTAFSNPLTTHQQFLWAREAGFNITDNMYIDTLYMLQALRESEGTGVKVMLNCPPTHDRYRAPEWAKRFSNDPRVAGYYIADEPSKQKFTYYKVLCDTLMMHDKNHMPYVNLLPNLGEERLGAKDYRDYVESFVDSLNLPIISFDYYPISIRNGKLRIGPELYYNLEVISDVCRRRGRTMWAYILSVPHNQYPEPKEEHLRFAAFTQLAYGAQGLQYFTYGTRVNMKNPAGWGQAIIDHTGRRTPIWKRVKKVNTEIRALQHIFLGAQLVGAWHTGKELPKGTQRLGQLPYPITQLLTEDEGVLVSELYNSGKKYLVIVNHSVTQKQKIRLDLKEKSTILQYDSKGKTSKFKGGKLTLNPGGYIIFQIS